MTFTIDRCPICGADPKEILETLNAYPDIARQEDGTFDYTGECLVDWDSQVPDEGANHEVALFCSKCCHRWETAVDLS